MVAYPTFQHLPCTGAIPENKSAWINGGTINENFMRNQWVFRDKETIPILDVCLDKQALWNCEDRGEAATGHGSENPGRAPGFATPARAEGELLSASEVFLETKMR